MTSSLAIVGSATWPTPADVIAYVDGIEPRAVLVTDDRPVVGGIVREAAVQRGLSTVVVSPNRVRDSDAASYRQSEAIVADASRLVAFVVKDPKTKRTTEGTALRIRLAERQGIPVEIVATPVPGRVCALIARIRHRYHGIATAPTVSHANHRIRLARELLAELVVVRSEYDRRLCDGWKELDAETDAGELERKTDVWLKWLRTHEVACDVIAEATALFATELRRWSVAPGRHRCP